ncbi:hypothetical protein [Konateibacter massiliensis]|uniref:hypothetical protein n=1 Tax=Konateibacter massiliensis TaxID=2002841 RepID=UPI000C14FF49|nr:hypothetical protein [Konateibacter massiliensis]
MSQEKVERYKKEKANRKEIMKKEKRKSLAIKAAAAVVGLAIVCWLSYSAYDVIQSNQAEKVVSVNLDSVTGYLAGVSAVTE